MKLAGPTEHMEDAWEKLGEGISLEQPRGDSNEVKWEGDKKIVTKMTFLGCEQRLVERTIVTPEGKKSIRGMEWGQSLHETMRREVRGRGPHDHRKVSKDLPRRHPIRTERNQNK